MANIKTLAICSTDTDYLCIVYFLLSLLFAHRTLLKQETLLKGSEFL